ncbi:protein O-mannosyl-transferase 2 [Cherax quadricarinatus]
MTCNEEINNPEDKTSGKGTATKYKIHKKRWLSLRSEEQWWVSLVTLTVLAAITRQTSLDEPPGTLWDEVHFGTFANHYINRNFYHDVHPPLGKMVIAGAAWLAGYNGTFDFQGSSIYTRDLNYVALRSMMAVLGSMLVPLSFLLVWELSTSLTAAGLAALCVLTDTFVHRLNTLILLDPLLLVTILASVYGITKFHNQRHRAWSSAWWWWLCFTGMSLGTVMSIKYVGAFTVLYVGLHTAYQLFCIAADTNTPLLQVLPHTAARAAALIILPTAVYLTTFVIHFSILTQWDVNGGGLYHTKFFLAFNGTEYDNATFPKYVHYGANVTIQSSRPICGYLESWYDLFPSELTAPCQQVTTSTIRDNETVMWTIKKVDIDAGSVVDGKDPLQEALLVRNGDYVMLTHAATGRSLRSHGHRAPITKRHYQVCGYGDDGAGGPFETWELLVPGTKVGEPLQVVEHDFLLRHYKINCFLKGNEKVVLPKEWAFNGAKEVTCTRNMEQPGTEWHINWNVSPKLKEKVMVKDMALGLWDKIIHQHLNMFISNSLLVGTEEEAEHSARPWMWPILWRIQMMGTYVVNKTSGRMEKVVGEYVPQGTTEKGVFSVGMTNPFLTYLNLVCLIGVLVLSLAHSYCNSRCPQENPHNAGVRRKALVACWWLAGCWAIHYLPFFFMSRVLYYHHYCPAYLFSCMITGVLLSWVSEAVAGAVRKAWQKTVKWSLLLLTSTALVCSYAFFWPLATHIKGEIFEANPRVNSGLDYFYIGQLWPEFGYRKSEYVSIVSTIIEKWSEGLLDNPDLNATLYYLTQLNYTAHNPGNIHPVHASNFSLWRPSTLNHAYLP